MSPEDPRDLPAAGSTRPDPATVDETLFSRLATREDQAIGITERFLRPVIGSGRTVAVLSEPLEGRRPVGVVLCHSFGLEQTYLARMDVQLARAASAAGFPVLRFHGQGYGDSEGGGDVGLDSHLNDARDAVSVLSDETGVETIAMLGTRFGASVALLIADRLGLPLAVAIEPMVSGKAYLRQFLRGHLFADWTARISDDPSASTRSATSRPMTIQDVRRDMDEQGWADIRGFRLTHHADEGIGALDLTTDLVSFQGSALVVGISRTDNASASLQRLVHHLRDLGADPSTVIIADPTADLFGQHNLRMSGGAKLDVLSGLTRELTSQVVAWFRAKAIAEEPGS